ncbi:MAG: cysteine desulfurase-like protein [Anaerolineales bacterium]|nr:cysteine desulfurase-like protein [Anaerolineales bacterium]
MSFDSTSIRNQFPALKRPAIYLDNPAGTQVPQRVIERMSAYLVECNANHGGAFDTSQQSDALVWETRSYLADFLNADRPEEIVFGPNMTSLTFNLSRSLAHTLNPGDSLVVTRLDHDANITPWVMVAEERDCHIHWVDFHPEDGRLNLEDFQTAMESKPRLVAVGYASNALGTINPLGTIISMAKATGALTFIDAVQYAPHGPIDVQQLDCDLLACSAYKFFGPHVGVLYGKFDLLDELTAYRVRPAPSDPPGKFETGTGNFEGIAGVLGALEYLEWLGETFGESTTGEFEGQFTGRSLQLKKAMRAIQIFEHTLTHTLLDVLEETPGVRVYGPTERDRLEERVPTVSFTLQVGAGSSAHSVHPRDLAQAFARENIYVWDGNYYALAVTERLGLEANGGMVRVGPVHYNTVEEIDRFGEALGRVISDLPNRRKIL